MADATLTEPRKTRGAGARRSIEELLRLADVGIDGARPFDLRVHDPRFYRRVLAEGALGLGESYMDGWWDCEQLDEFFHRVLRARLQEKIVTVANAWEVIKARV
jgi:cyclopropane-fatty-acyl-phospholipid synthase